MTTENSRMPFKPRVLLAAFGLALASLLSAASAFASNRVRHAGRALACAVLVLLGWSAYRGTLSSGFISDDEILIVRNPAVRSLTPAVKFLRPESQYFHADKSRHTWRPLPLLAYALEYRAAGLNPGAYHLVNVLIHIANALLVFGLIAMLFGSPWVAFITAAVFLLHPVQTETVSWIAEQGNLMFLFFYLLSWIFFVRSQRRADAGQTSGRSLAFSLACFVLSLLSKEMAATLPLTLGLWLYVSAPRSRARAGGAFSLIPYFGMLFVYMAARSLALGKLAQTGYWAGDLGSQVLTMFKAFALYAKLALLPRPLSFEYTFAVKHMMDGEVLGCALLLAGIVGFGIWRARKNPMLGFGILFFFLALAPVSNLIPINTILNERYLYASMIGWGLVVSAVLAAIAARLRRTPAVLCGVVLAVAYLGLTMERNLDWHDTGNLARATVATCPQSARAHGGLAKAYYDEGKWREAIDQYRLALSIQLVRDPNRQETYQALGSDVQEQAYQASKMLQARVDEDQAFLGLGTAYLRLGEPAKAVRFLEEARRLSPEDSEIGNNLAVALATGGELDRAIETLQELTAKHPEDAKAARNLSIYEGKVRQLAADKTETIRFVRGRFPQVAHELDAARDGAGGRSMAALKPEETMALEALARREGRAAERGFLPPQRYGPVTIGPSAGRQVVMTPLGSRAVPASMEEGAAVYREAYPGVDVLALSSPARLETLYLVRRAPASGRFSLAFGLKGLNDAAGFKLANGKLQVLSLETGAAVLELSAPLVFDAQGRSAPASYALNGAGPEGVLTMSFDTTGLMAPFLIDPAWTVAGTGSMSGARDFPTATLLPSGKVLIAGGFDGTSLSTAELYDPVAGTWTTTGSMSGLRSLHTATLLPNGKVLVAGGQITGGIYLSTAELYDPVAGTWTTTGSLGGLRMTHTATLLPSGQVLVVGGNSGSNLSTAELYDPVAGTWTTTGAMSGLRALHTATLLPSGKVLVAGGGTLSTAELYDPGAGTWTTTGSMSVGRQYHTATLLPSGKVLVSGGSLSTAELYDPVAGTWTTTGSMSVGRQSHTATLLPSGKVLVAGGFGGGNALSTVELYDPAAGTWTTTGSMSGLRQYHTATLLPNGKVFIAGGDNNSFNLSTTELYDPSAGAWANTGSMSVPRQYLTATLLPNGKVLVAGGLNSGGNLSTAELYDPLAGTWTTTSSMSSARSQHTATLLPSGKVLVAGGNNPSSLSTSELYDPAAGTWTTTGSMSGARMDHTATLLPSGKVLVAGGYPGTGPNSLSTAELYDPAAGTWTTTGSLSGLRRVHTATLLPSGKVLVAGSYDGIGYLSTAELYDPTVGTWTTTGSMSAAYSGHTATLLPSGKVLVAGGYGGSWLSTAELYDPVAGTWTTTGSMSGIREAHSATLLPSGKVLVVGGQDASSTLSTAELYDPAAGTWTTTGSMSVARGWTSATLLPSGKVLVVGGQGGGAYLSTAELVLYTEYDYTLPAVSAARPQIVSVNGSSIFPVTVSTGALVAVTGSAFTGLGEGYPRVYLRAMDTGSYGTTAEGSNLVDLSTSVYEQSFSATTLQFKMPASLRPGYYLFWVQSNAIPSTFTVLHVPAPLLPGWSVAGISPLGYTGLSAAGFTANWSSTLPGGTVFYLQLSMDAFATINSTHTATNTNFTFSGLAPSTVYNVRLSTLVAGGAFVNLGSVATPGGGGGAVNFNFFNNGAAVIGSANGQNETGLGVAVDRLSGGGPYTYVVFASTPGATASRNSGHDTAGVVGLVKYGPSGTLVSSRTLAVDSDGTMALDAAGNVYVAEMDKSLGPNSRWITKYAPSLYPLFSRAVSSAAVGGFGAMISDGISIYALIEDRNDNTVKLVAYDANLTALATSAPYGLGSGNPVRGYGIAGDDSGFGYVLVSSDSPNAPVHLLKYPLSSAGALNGAGPASDVVIPGATNKQDARATMVGGKIYVAFPSQAGTSVFVREFDASLNYTGVSSTITNTAAPFGKARVAIESDGNSVYVAATAAIGGGGDYLVTRYAGGGLAFLSSATFNSPTYLADQAFGLALGQAGEVYVTGASSDTISNANAATVRFVMGNVSASCGPGLLFAGPVTAVSTHSLTFNWTPDGCPLGTVYTAMISSNSFSTIAASLQTTNPYAVFSSLQPGTAYSAVVSTTGVFTGGLGVGTGATFSAGTLSITGTVGYAGLQTGGIIVEAFTTAGMTGAPSVVQKLPDGAAQAYYLPLGAATYYLRASLDVLGNGVPQAGADQGTLGPVVVSASSMTGQNFTIAVDSVAPNAIVGVSAYPTAGQIQLTWGVPSSNANGTALVDLRGYIIQRSTGGGFSGLAGSPSVPISSASLSFTDWAPVPGVTNSYRVVAVDYGQNQSAPSASASVASGGTASGGMIAGNISAHTVTGSGTYRVRLYSSPGGPFLAESNENPFSFSGLSSGTYYLKGFRDLDEDGAQGSFEPAGTAGGLHQNPYPIFISGTNAPIMDVAVCDRGLLQVGPAVSGALSPSGCPALDAGPNRRTNLLAFEAGTGAPGSISTGTALAISMTGISSSGASYGSQLIVLGPNGQLVASNSSPSGASVSFTPVEFGVYVVEPTSQWELSNGTYSVTMSAGASGAATEGISGTVSYAGSQGGANVVRFFANNSFSGIPLATFTVSGAGGSFTQLYLPAGAYTVDAYRDTAGAGFNPSYQAYGRCNGGAPFVLPGGTVEPIGACTLNDPAASGTSGTSSLSGSLRYNGGVTGTVRTGLYPYGSNSPVRFESSALAPSVSFNFNAISSGTYILKSFIDANDGNFMPDSSEPVVTSTSSGFFLETGVNRTGANFTLCDRSPIVPGTPVTFSLSSNCPAPDHAGSYMKLYTFQGQSGQPVTLEADAINFTDSYLYLYDPNGNLIAYDDDSGGSYNAKLSEFPLPLNGLYTVGAGPYGADINGQIELSVTLSGGALGSISGIVDYTGTQGGSIQVAVFTSTSFNSATFIQGQVLTSTRVFQFPDLFTGTTYYLGAFIDVNSNDNPDPGEDGGVFGIGNTASPIYLLAGQNVTGASIQIGASTTTAAGASHVTGGVFYSGARTGAVILEFWPSAQFMGSPIAVRNIPTGVVDSTATYDVSLPGGANYFMRAFVDVNGDFIPNPDEPKGVYAPNGTGAEALYVPMGQTLTGINIPLRDPGFSASGVTAGEGSATLSPSALTPGQPAFLTVIYTAGPSGITDGTIGFSAPNGYPFPEMSFSSITVRSTATFTFTMNYAGPSVFMKVDSGAVLAGQQVELEWSNFYVPCAVGVQTVTVSAVQGAGAPPAPLFGGSPTVSIAAGAPRFFQPRNPYFSLRQGEFSEAQVLEARDSCGNGVPLVSGSTVSIHSAMWSQASSNFVSNPDINLSAAVDASTTSNLDLYFPAGASTRAFYVVGTSTGFHNLQVFFNLGFESTYYYGLSVVPANALTAVSVSSSTSGQALSATTISAAAATGVINPVFVNFTLGDPNQSWRVLFSSVPYRPDVQPTPVWERWGFGQPTPSEIVWDGRFSPWINGGVRVPNGLYYGRVELGGGGVRNETIRVSVALPQFAGRAYDSGTIPNPPLSSVQLRVYGPSGFYTATTGSDGRYAIPGLGAGTYRLNLSRADYIEGYVDMELNAAGAATSFTPRTPGVLVSSNATGGLDIFIGRSPRLIVVPSLDDSILPADIVSEQWGNLQVRPSTSTNQQSTFYGPMRLQANTTTFDDGGQWDSGTQQFVARTLLGFNIPVGTYSVVADLNGYSRSTGSVYVGPEGARLDLPAFVPKAVVTGTVNLLAAAPPGGLSVGISAVALSTMTGSARLSGGTFINAGQTSAVYSISGFDAGGYLLRANTQGFSAISIPIVVVGTNALTGQNFPNFDAGASISGAITAVGAADGQRIWVNAWSPGSYNFGSTVVYTSGGAAAYELNGLDAGATYQLYANIDGGGGKDYDLTFPAGGFPIAVFPPNLAMNFTLAPASGVVSGLILLPAGSTDFTNVTLIGLTVASLKPDQVGKTFVEVSTSLPNFLCADGSSGANGYCPSGISSATFKVMGANTETIDLRFLHSTTGQSSRQILSILNGSTSTVVADLRASTYAISGFLINQITDALFNTNAKIVANAPYIRPQNYPLGLSSTTARVTALRQEIDSYGAAISTVFNPVSSRVGFLDAAGAFMIPNIPNGVYIVRTTDLRSCSTCAVVAPSVARTVTVSGADVSSVTLTVSNGYSVSGTISLDGGMLDARVFELRVLNRRQEIVRSTVAYLGDANLGQTAGSVDYAFTNLPAGEFYTLTVRGQLFPIKYAGRPIRFPDPTLSPTGLQSNLTRQDVLMQRAAYLTGRLKDGGTGELIGASNATLLAPNFAITATANPWIEGGFVAAASSVSARPIEADGYFRVGPLMPDVTYDLRLAQATWDPNFLASGSQNYAPVTIGGLKPATGEIRDVGTIALGQGQSITGVVRSTATGTALGNVKVTARPSFGGDGLVVQTFTNRQGIYSLWVSTLVSNQFNLTAAPRDGNQASDGFYYGTVVLSNVNLQTQTSADFLLSPLSVVVTGQVLTADAATGGALSYPFGDKRGFPAAAINLQPVGVVSNNPLGDIETATDERGFFSIPSLSTGFYALHATSLGYSVYNATVQVLGSTFRIFVGSNTPFNDLPGGVLTLARGATATGRILKSDGTSPNSTEVVGVAAANFAAGEFVVGSVETDAVAKTVSAYTISGFKTGVSYDIVLLSGSNGKEVSFPTEGAGVVFSAAESTATKSINLTYRPAELDCLGTAKALGGAPPRFLVQIDCLKPLRQETAADDDLATILTRSNFTAAGASLDSPNSTGILHDPSNSTSRRRLTATYTLAVSSEARFSIRVRASAAEVDPRTGDNFAIDKVFDFYAGLDASADGRASNINGGSVGMNPSADDERLGRDERSRIDLPPGAFSVGYDTDTVAGVAHATTTVNVSMSKGYGQQLAKALSLAAVGYAPAALSVADVPSAFPAEMWAAMSQYRTMASTTQVGGANPISAFYSIFLPAGIRHQLKQRADLTLSYNLSASTSTTDDKIQVWFYNAFLGRFVPETVNRRLDTVNKTITVSVDHFSTFVVLDSTPVATSNISFGGPDIAVANFPNPADCISHSNIARNSTLFGSGGTHAAFVGTMLRASIPLSGTPADLRYNIYTVAGEKIRTIEQGSVPAGQTYYTPWNCTNDSGRTVASGVYIGEVIHGGRRKFFKIAIIKGSGL